MANSTPSWLSSPGRRDAWPFPFSYNGTADEEKDEGEEECIVEIVVEEEVDEEEDEKEEEKEDEVEADEENCKCALPFVAPFLWLPFAPLSWLSWDSKITEEEEKCTVDEDEDEEDKEEEEEEEVEEEEVEEEEAEKEEEEEEEEEEDALLRRSVLCLLFSVCLSSLLHGLTK